MGPPPLGYVLGCYDIKSSVFGVYFSWYGSDHHVTSRIRLDQAGPLSSPAGGRLWVPTWVKPKHFWPLSLGMSKNYAQWRYSKGFTFSIQENRLPLFPTGFELSPCKGGQFNIDTIQTGRILTPKRPIDTMCYWLRLGCRRRFTAHKKLRRVCCSFTSPHQSAAVSKVSRIRTCLGHW